MPTRRTLLLFVMLALVTAACGAAEPYGLNYRSSQSESYAEEMAESESYAGESYAGAQQAPEVTRAVAEGVAAGAPYQSEAAAADNFFRDYGVNPYVDPHVDNLSTFALDVDTGAYSVARRYIRDGRLPPPEAVRVEEFINYFEQGYSLPGEVAFAVYADGAPSPFHGDGTYLLRIGVQGYDVAQAERLPANLTFVIDVSGSMAHENRLGLVKGALELLVEQLRPDDRVAVVVYGSSARVVLEPTSIADRGRILDAIYRLQPEGSTNAEAGLRLGYEMANLGYRAGGINRVILASDGVANVGLTNPDGLAQEIRRAADGGIQLTSIGVGMGNFNDVLMEQLADQGDGHYAYVDTQAEAHRVFVEELTGTLQVIALDAKVQVAFSAETVGSYRLIGYENRAIADQAFRDDSVDAGEIGAGHSATALYALQLRPGSSGRVATVSLRWRDPQSGLVHEIHGDVHSQDLEGAFGLADPRFQLAAVAAQYAELLRNSYWAGDTSYAELAGMAAGLAGQLPFDPDVAEFAALVADSARLRR